MSEMSGSTVSKGKVALIILAAAMLVFPGLVVLGLLKPTDEHRAIAAQRVGDAVRLPVFVAHSRERIGDRETVMAETIYLLPKSVKLLSIITISRTGAATETKVDVSRFRGLMFVGLMAGSLIYIGRWIVPMLKKRGSQSET
jgi:hypothetical protein